MFIEFVEIQIKLCVWIKFKFRSWISMNFANKLGRVVPRNFCNGSKKIEKVI